MKATVMGPLAVSSLAIVMGDEGEPQGCKFVDARGERRPERISELFLCSALSDSRCWR